MLNLDKNFSLKPPNEEQKRFGEMIDNLHQAALLTLRRQHPDWSEKRLQDEACVLAAANVNAALQSKKGLFVPMPEA